MSGLLLIAIVLLWFWVVIVIARVLTSRIEPVWIKRPITFCLVTLIVPLPVADEIIGGMQFRALCNEQMKIAYGIGKLTNRTVFSQIRDETKLEGMAIPVHSYEQVFIDIKTHETLLTYQVFDADGGWLSRAINFNYVHKPYTFNGHCGPGAVRVEELLRKLNVTVIRKWTGE